MSSFCDPTPSEFYPIWYENNCYREVAQDLFVGPGWALYSTRRFPYVIDLCGAAYADPKIRPPYADSAVLSCSFEDGTPFPGETLQTILKWDKIRTQPQHNAMLIHCAQGISRSVTAAVAVLMLNYGLEEAEALRRARSPERLPHPVTYQSMLRWVENRRGL